MGHPVAEDWSAFYARSGTASSSRRQAVRPMWPCARAPRVACADCTARILVAAPDLAPVAIGLPATVSYAYPVSTTVSGMHFPLVTVTVKRAHQIGRASCSETG